MDKQYVIAIRNVFEQIKIKTSNGVEHVPTMVLKLDNDAWIDDSKCELFWDDAKEVCFYYHYNQLRNMTPAMIGRDHVSVPAVLSAFDYGEIQEMKILLSKDALKSSFNAIQASGAKARVDANQVGLNDALKKKIYDKYVNQTCPATDMDLYTKGINDKTTIDNPYK